MSIFFHRFRSCGKRPLGFTLIELLVVISIMLVITSLLLMRQQQFNSSTLLRSLAYSIALSVRQAQAYGTSVREFGGVFNAKGYGINFNTTDLQGTPPTKYILFADSDNDGIYDAPGEFAQDFKIGRGYTVTTFCGVWAVPSNGTKHSCSTGGVGGGTQISALNIYFVRPNLDANFRSNTLTEVYTSAYLQIQSVAGATRNIIITNTGRIAVCTLNAVYPVC